MAEQYLIVGNGIAGVTAAEILRAENASAGITVVADDPFPVYYRPALKDYLAGRVREERLWARPASFYQDLRIRFLSARVSEILAAQHYARLQDGRQIGYSRLLLACGARASTLHCPGHDLAGVTTLRTVADYQAVQQRLRQVRRVVVSGSGTLALETIETLRHRGFAVTHLVRRHTLWSEVLDDTASDLVLQQERRDGVDVRTATEIAEITGQDGQVTGVVCNNGAFLPCELVLVAIGVEPVVDFIKSSGIPCERGVVVDRAMRTPAPDIYAAGDVLETNDETQGRKRVIGQWFPAVQQARAAAYSMLDQLDTTQAWPANTFYNATFLYGLEFASAGLTRLPQNARDYQEIIADPQPRTYRKIILKDGVAVGILALGRRGGALACKRAIDHRVSLTPVITRLFADDFDLDAWLDQQGVPSPLLRVGPRRDTASEQPVVSIPAVNERSAPSSEADSVGKAFLVPLVIFEQNKNTIPESAKTPLDRTGMVTVGRQAGIALLIDHASVSRRHAEISYRNGQYILRDAGSSNGTFVNKTRLPAGDTHVLQTGETISFGKVAYVFLREEPLPTEKMQETILSQTRLIEHATGFYDPGARDLAPDASQPLLNADGSLLLPGAREAIPAAALAALKAEPALVAILQGQPRISGLKAGKAMSLGREKQCEIVLPDMSVSRKHAEVFYGGDGFYLRDLGSSNGVAVNRTRIDNPYRLAHGDRLQIGGVTLFFLQPENRQESLPARVSAGSGCRVCGVEIPQGARFCAHCGAIQQKAVLQLNTK